jgi:asparagine synthase (glutamine-hydrolysing)
MCGIAGFFSFNGQSEGLATKLSNAIETLSLRGPDYKGVEIYKNVGLAHSRLSIIDTSQSANQPFVDESGRYKLVFNGEIFNYKALQKEYLKKFDIKFKSNSDTEVLLHLLINYQAECLNWLSGFFAIAFYDKEKNTLLLARDRYGKKPLHIFQNEDHLLFASELKAIMAFGIKKEIDTISLYQYFQLNYIPQPYSILKNTYKLAAGHYAIVSKDNVIQTKYYEIDSANMGNSTLTYEAAQKALTQKLEHAVTSRLISDVPLGAFLSGGIDSSVVVALASRHQKNLNTFSIGFADEPFFDETSYAKLVANKYKTNHTVFSLKNSDLFEEVNHILDYIDEPFADSSAIAVYILSKNTRKYATVALSGDGADEVFGGYNKYAAEYKIQQGGAAVSLIKAMLPLWQILPTGRNNKVLNIIRQLKRFGTGGKLTNKERHYLWCAIMDQENASNLIKQKVNSSEPNYLARKNEILKFISNTNNNFNANLLTDVNLVLQGDMLVKVDLMSMANSLEVRSPFLDNQVVDFAFSLPSHFKISANKKKIIVQDTFRNILPAELYNRPKHGFEVPLLKWFKNEMHSSIENFYLETNFLKEQNIFSVETIAALKNKLHSNSPGDSAAQIWALIVFQHWYKKYFLN